MELLLSRPEASASALASKELEVTSSAFPAFIWSGVTHRRLESLEPGAAIRLILEFVPITIGLQVSQSIDSSYRLLL